MPQTEELGFAVPHDFNASQPFTEQRLNENFRYLETTLDGVYQGLKNLDAGLQEVTAMLADVRDKLNEQSGTKTATTGKAQAHPRKDSAPVPAASGKGSHE